MALGDRNSMDRIARPDGLNINPRNSFDPHSPRPAMSPAFSIASLPSVNPEPAYIAPTAAATIISSELEGELGVPVYDERGHPVDGAMVSPNSLALVNSFLDRLLFNFLLSARSTTLASLRPAIVEVLKPRLAKDAIAGADEELHEYLGGDDDELNAFHGGQDTPRDWDLDLVWRRARLRCMVYTRLGDMEEEDEEMYIEQEHLDDYDSDERVAREIGMVSPAVAIFLTSILEFVGEHALIIATHAAFKRIDSRARAEAQIQNRLLQGFPRVMVEETDVEKIALNANLGRLWRAWRKQIRSPRDSASSRAFRGFGAGTSSRKSSITGASEMQGTVPSVAEVLEPDPTAVPLPMTEQDVNEIEVPGYSAARALHVQNARGQLRPASLLVTKDWLPARPNSMLGDDEVIEEDSGEETPIQESWTLVSRVRAHSLPVDPKSTAMDVQSDADSESFATPDEEMSQRHVEDRHELAGEPVQAVGKPISEPATPSYRSVLNVLSRHVARELQKSPPAEVDSNELAREDDPADGALAFTGNDYIINDHERDAMKSQYYGTTVPAINLHQSGGNAVRASGASSVYPDGARDGPVSPIEHEPVQSGEVSPIEPSDDEREVLSTKRNFYHEPVSPLIDHQEAAPSQAIPVAPVPLPVQTKPSLAAKAPSPPQVSPAQLSPITPTARQRRPEESTAAKNENREAVVLAAVPPSPLRSHPSNVPPASKPARYSPETPSSAPNLAPLREMMEAAPDSDEASSVNPQEKEPTHISRRSKGSSTGKPMSSAPSARSKPLPPVNVPPGVEKAAVQRMTPGGSRHSTSISNRSSDIPAPTPRGQSLTEKAKNRITSSGLRGSMGSRPSGEEKTSEERASRSSMGGNDQSRQFDDLLASEETVQYTLTPQNMRNIEDRKSVVVTSPTIASIKSPMAPPKSNPPAQRPAEAAPATPPKPRDPATTSSIGRRVVSGVPREARVPRSNTQDFADFIRSTGPDGGSSGAPLPPPPQLNKSLPSVSTRSSQIAKSQGRIRTSKGGERLQARDAQVRRSQNDELIALLNQGPPSERASERASAGPTAAPPRKPAPGQKFDQNSVASTVDSYVARSVQSSTNSRTGLLETNNNRSAVGKRAPVASNEDDMPPVKRTQRRIKDPYAISDDEDEDENASTPTAAAPGGGTGKEESLVDFLNSVPPPADGNPPPTLNLSKSTIQAMQRRTSNAGAKARAAVAPGATKLGGKITAAAAAARQRTGSISGGGGGGDDDSSGPAPSRRAKASFQARDERAGKSSTRELADFLASAPPPGGEAPAGGFAGSGQGGREGDGGFSRMFSRRRGKSGMA